MYFKIPYNPRSYSRCNREGNGWRGTTRQRLIRQMPNALLDRYFEARWLFDDLDFSAMKETQPDELFAAWLTDYADISA